MYISKSVGTDAGMTCKYYVVFAVYCLIGTSNCNVSEQMFFDANFEAIMSLTFVTESH